MIQTTAVVVGAGHAGLAMSRRLTERSIDHVVLERGEVANSWRTQRWPSLRLLTPNWQTRLPGHDYAGDDPDGFMPAAGVVATLTALRPRLIGAPVRTATTVHTVRAAPRGFQIRANDDLIRARAVVLATGACTRPAIPRIADAVPPSITTLTPLAYRDPGQLPDGGVLVVGASATGVQLADEIHRSGRPVTLAVGEHVRLPRTYRGRDIFWWLEATGLLAERYDEVDDLTRARHLPSPQLTGTPEAVTTDLNTLTALGVRIVGRLGRIVDGVAQFSGALANGCALADLKMNRFLNRADEWATESGLDDEPPHRTASRPPASIPAPLWNWTSPAGRSPRCCGRPASGPTTPGSTSPCATARAASATTAAWSPAPPDSTCSACRCSAPAPPPTSTAQPPTPTPWPATSTPSSAAGTGNSQPPRQVGIGMSCSASHGAARLQMSSARQAAARAAPSVSTGR